MATRGSCVHPVCLAAYRRYLQQEYGDLAALNQSWGASYASLDEVAFSTPRDNDEAEAFNRGNYPRWYDRQAFQSYNQLQLCRRFGERFTALDPQAVTGFEGAGVHQRRAFGFAEVPQRVQRHPLASDACPPRIRGGCTAAHSEMLA